MGKGNDKEEGTMGGGEEGKLGLSICIPITDRWKGYQANHLRYWALRPPPSTLRIVDAVIIAQLQSETVSEELCCSVFLLSVESQDNVIPSV